MSNDWIDTDVIDTEDFFFPQEYMGEMKTIETLHDIYDAIEIFKR